MQIKFTCWKSKFTKGKKVTGMPKMFASRERARESLLSFFREFDLVNWELSVLSLVSQMKTSGKGRDVFRE